MNAQTRQRQVFQFIHRSLQQTRVPAQERQRIREMTVSLLPRLVGVSPSDAARLVRASFDDATTEVRAFPGSRRLRLLGGFP